MVTLMYAVVLILFCHCSERPCSTLSDPCAIVEHGRRLAMTTCFGNRSRDTWISAPCRRHTSRATSRCPFCRKPRDISDRETSPAVCYVRKCGPSFSEHPRNISICWHRWPLLECQDSQVRPSGKNFRVLVWPWSCRLDSRLKKKITSVSVVVQFDPQETFNRHIINVLVNFTISMSTIEGITETYLWYTYST